ncbi:MAG: GNAT family N-acetyltransferase [Actinomycetia bacterium]|nr:GNAT family N-acetyltransferase [Actinomycetes bacterium]MCP4962054.1 GNAT family N-acetyltransferase [Actinomycetes bacterium]
MRTVTLRYVNLAPVHVEALEELELTVFETIDPADLYDAAELSRLAHVFPDGNFVVLDGERPIGMGLGLFVEFDFDHTDHRLTDITGEDGVSNHSMDHPWYYGTDISVYPEYRGRGIGRALYELRKDCVRRFNKRGIVAGGVLPGYRDHIDNMSADEYIDRVVAGELYDPTLTFQLQNGFTAHGALTGYVEDPSVGNNSVLIAWHNPDYVA